MLDLTNYEMLDLAHAHIANATDDLNRLAAAFTAYLVVAYRAGKELTRFQVTVVNVFFIAVRMLGTYFIKSSRPRWFEYKKAFDIFSC